jgi:16S rRNA C1402 (ribose-2'-O) methylase RsmI
VKEIVDILSKEKIICKKLDEVAFKTKKRVKIYFGINIKNEYCLIVKIYKKSRFLRKDIPFLEEIEKSFDNKFKSKRKILILNEICSKAKKELKEWRVIDGVS